MNMAIDIDQEHPKAGWSPSLADSSRDGDIAVTLLTGGSDKPYVYGLTSELISKGASIDLVGSNELDCPEYHGNPRLKFLNLRGDQDSKAGLRKKVFRILAYYWRLIRYAIEARPKVFHILWDNKFLYFDRTLLMCYYKLLGKKIVLTAHNVNAGKRDNNDSLLNRLTLRIQYHLADHLFVHTAKMKQELMQEFGVPLQRVSIIPLGINNFAHNTGITSKEARERLGIREDEKALLFFGRITPYKGLEYLVSGFQKILVQAGKYRLIIAGRPEEEDAEQYWAPLREKIREDVQSGRILLRAEHIPDEETEVYFKAADVLVLPYRDIYQSGILFLGYSFGLPALVSDVGSLKDEVVEGGTGFVFKPEDPVDLALVVEKYFASELFRDLSGRRQEIQRYASAQHDWGVVGKVTISIYKELLGGPF